MKKGFTLIELLVVVLIIGILSAIALPKYQVAVAKTHYVQLITNVESIYKAQQVYYMATGKYATSMEDLDIQIPGTHHANANGDDSLMVGDNYRCYLNVHDGVTDSVYCSNRGIVGHNAHMLSLPDGKRSCVAYDEDKTAEKTCQSLGGKYNSTVSSSGDSYKIYNLP